MCRVKGPLSLGAWPSGRRTLHNSRLRPPNYPRRCHCGLGFRVMGLGFKVQGLGAL